MSIGFVGGGNMAEALIKGMLEGSSFKAQDIFVSEPKDDRRRYLEQTYGIKTTGSNKDVASTCNIIILAVKPQNMDSVLEEIGERLTEEKTIVSIAAGITFNYLTSRLRSKKLIRVMPNTPALVQEGISVMSLCECFSDPSVSVVREIFMSIGEVITLPEKYMNAVTALSGSGPAFIAIFIEAMIEAGVKMGLNNNDATTLVIQTAIGTSRLLDTGMSPSRLREMVTSPGGTTEAGLRIFNEKGLREIVTAAIEAATKRAEELGKGRA